MVTQVRGSIKVNPHTLHAFGTSLGDDVHKQVKPHADRLRLVFADGVSFGERNPSADLQAAAVAYHDCLVGVNQQLQAVVDAVSVLADSAQKIAERYASSDTLADARAKDVQAVLDATAAARVGLAAPHATVTRYE